MKITTPPRTTGKVLALRANHSENWSVTRLWRSPGGI